MTQMALERLPDALAELVRKVQSGDEITFTDNERPVARLISLAEHKRARKAGSAKHLPHFMADDFDATPEGFEEYMP